VGYEAQQGFLVRGAVVRKQGMQLHTTIMQSVGEEKGGSHASKHQLTPATTCPRNCYSIQSYYTPCTFYIILDACDKTCTSVSECRKSYRITDHKVSITESMDRLSRAWNGCWKNLWPKAVKVLQGAPKQQDEIRNILVLACKVLGE